MTVSSDSGVSAVGVPPEQPTRAPSASPRSDPARRERRKRVGLGAASVITVIALYTLLTARAGNNPALTPPPGDVISALWKSIQDGNLVDAIGSSLGRIAVGYVVGAGSAVILGSLMGWFPLVEYVFDPLVEAVRPIPPLAYIPLVLIWFGIGEFSRVLVLTLACFVTCIVNVTAGMKEVPGVYVDAASTLGASRFRVFRTVAIPSALPYIFTGLRVALAAAWTTLVAAELLAAQNGLGFLLQQGRRYFLADQVMFTIAVIGVLAFTMDRCFRLAQRRLTRWSEVRR